jgi:tyrosine-protein kinase Etk/Wzc
MNARTPLQNQLALQPVPAAQLPAEDEINFAEYFDLILDHRWLVISITVLAVVLGSAYAFLARPVYEANLLIQVEDSASSAKSFLGDAANLFDVKTAAASEIEIIRSRMVLGQAVDNTSAFIKAAPRYLPLIGNWMARHSKGLSTPGFLGLGGFVTGTERIAVKAFDVPPALEGSLFRLTVLADQHYVLSHPKLAQELAGQVGAPLVRSTPFGTVTLMVTEIEALPGADFNLERRSRLDTMEDLQRNLKVNEKGRQSGIIEATLQDPDASKLTQLLNEIGRQYVRQNVERKAAEAQKMLAFLDVQMPQFKKQLDQSDEAYSRYRNQKGTISLDEEAKAALAQELDLQGKLMEARQKRLELLDRFTPEHPAIKTLDDQIASWNRAIAGLNARVRLMPTVQQEALRLERDVKVNNEAYQNLRNNVLQLQLMREGKVGNVRLIDSAALPEQPVSPKKPLVVALAGVLGLLAGICLVLARNALFRAVRSPEEVEANTGVSVYSTIPLSETQQTLATRAAERKPGVHVLAAQSPNDPAVEAIRSLRTALQFAMLDAPNNRVLITGATPGVGKSFASANFAAVLASGGKRVLLVDADLRKGYLNHYFGVSRERGLSEVVAGTLTYAEAIRASVLPNLDLLTTGVLPPNPAELIMSGALAGLLDALSSEYDFVIMDSPPVLAAADTLGMSALTGTVLLVARAGLTQMGELNEAVKRLAHTGKTVSGVLFNGMDLSRRHYGSYAYRYGGYRYRHYSYEPRQ